MILFFISKFICYILCKKYLVVIFQKCLVLKRESGCWGRGKDGGEPVLVLRSQLHRECVEGAAGKGGHGGGVVNKDLPAAQVEGA